MLDMTMKRFLIKAFTCIAAALMLGMIFIAYFAPETMIAISNQVWALCGW
jgi:hypothetical protein